MDIADQALADVVKGQVQDSPYVPYLQYLLQGALAGVPTFLYGGALRNMLLKHFHGQNVDAYDYDLLIDDLERRISYPEIFEGRGRWKVSGVKSIVWRPEEEIKIELIPFSEANSERRKVTGTPSLELMLATTDFTMNAVGYDLHSHLLYHHNALDDIQQRQIELLYTEGTTLPRYLVRLVSYAERLQFSIGPQARRFVQERYTPALDSEIKTYLHMRKTPDLIPHILGQLRELVEK